MSKKPPIANTLKNHAISALLAAIEVHNKPNFSFRYETATILTINAWELLLKAFIYKKYGRRRIFGNKEQSIDFEKCLNLTIEALGKEFIATSENLKHLYKMRCDFVHFYTSNIEILLFSLLHKSIKNFLFFLEKNFQHNMSDFRNFYILPLGIETKNDIIEFFKSEKAKTVKNPQLLKLLDAIHKSTQNLISLGISEPIISDYSLHIHHSKSKTNADFYARLNEDSDNPNVVFKSEVLIDRYPFSYNELCKKIQQQLPKVKKNKVNEVIKRFEIKENPEYSVLNHRNKKDQEEFEKNNKIKTGTPYIYNSKAVDFLVEKLKELPPSDQ